MQQFTHQITVSTHGRKLYDITPEVVVWANRSGLHTGLITLYIQHNSHENSYEACRIMNLLRDAKFKGKVNVKAPR